MFVIEVTPQALVYLTKLMDAPTVSVKAEDVMTHAQIRQQLAQPTESAKLVAQLKTQGAQEALQQREGGAPPAGDIPVEHVH